MSSLNDTRTSKVLGALLGVHCGDSLGATFEFRTWSSILQQYPDGLREIVGGGSFRWPAGHATDDTDLTRAVLLAYLDKSKAQKSGNAEFDIAKAAAEHSLKWYEGDWPGRKAGRRPADIGGATEFGLRSFKESGDTRKSGAGMNQAGNGSLMRCIPTALFTSALEMRVKESMAISEFTHDDPRCTVACAAYNEIVAAIIEGKTTQEAVKIGKSIAKDLDGEEVVDAIKVGETLPLAKMATEGPGKSGFTPSGYVLDSLKLSIAALLDPRSFEDVLVDVVRLGDDSDTNGAIAGGLLGARDGVESIPERWLEKLQFREEFEEVAEGILRM
jgi:ADP-ribosylglycohydrolase